MSDTPYLSAEPVLRAVDLRKTFRMGSAKLEVLRGTHIDLHRGEVCALMGSSGSGKSTLLNLLGLLDRPDSGKLWMDGREVQNLGQAAAARLRASNLGFVFQQFQLLPELNALENVLMPRRLVTGGWRGRRKIERQRAQDALDRVGLSARMRHKPAQLSGGEQQRVAIARALISQPAVLLADEPTGNLDRNTSAEVLELLLAMGREHQAAVLLATHDPKVAERCDHILRMRDGVLHPDS
jgi:predicted ABC-type transport system involved in lysophospholipase L1 biosynthesis ATPase subunit